jgi:hypothetical protein
VGNLHVLGATYLPGLYYERGLLHPFIDYDVPPAWLNTLVDPMDAETRPLRPRRCLTKATWPEGSHPCQEGHRHGKGCR